MVGLYAAAQNSALPQDVLLPRELVETAWPHPGGQGSLPAERLPRAPLEEVRYLTSTPTA